MPRPHRGSTASTGSTHDAAPSAQELASMYDFLAKIILLGPSGCGKSCLLHRFVQGEWRVLTSQTIGVEFASKIVRVVGSGGRRRTRVKLQLWDTAGTERFRSVSRSYYRGAAGAVLVYDVGNSASFAALPTFLSDARALASPQLTVLLAGNKVDLADPVVPTAVKEDGTREENDGGGGGGGRRRRRDTGNVGSPTTRSTSSAVPGLGSQLRATVSAAGRAVPAAVAASWASQNRIPASVEVSALSGEGVDEVFDQLARSIVTKIELGEIDPDDPMSGIQYGDADYYRYDDGSSSVKSGGLTSDGAGGSSSLRRRHKKAGLGDVFRIGRHDSVGTRTRKRNGRCC